MVLISLTVYRNSQISSVIRRWPDSRCCFRGDKLGYLVVAKHCHHFGSCVNTISNNGSRFLYQRGNCIGCCFFQRISKQILAQVQFCGCWLFFLFMQDRDGSSLLCMVLHRLVDKIQIQLQVKNETQLFEKCFFHYCRWDNGKMNIPHRILTPDDPDTGIPGKYTEVNTSNECVTTPQSSYGDVSTWQFIRIIVSDLGCSTWDQ